MSYAPSSLQLTACDRVCHALRAWGTRHVLLLFFLSSALLGQTLTTTPKDKPDFAKVRTHRFILPVLLLILLPLPVVAQGTLDDYKLARRFLPQNVSQLVLAARVVPNWIGSSNRFWYSKINRQGTQFILVDAERNTASPAFDR
jgi:hypothetical protein